MAKATSILQLARRLRTHAKAAASPRLREDLNMAATLLERLAQIVEEALTRAACA
jgi:hypothetical protein